MLRGARAGKLDPNRVIESSVEIVVASVTDRREHWRFIGRERSSGVTVLRYAIRTEFRLSPRSWPPTSRASRGSTRGAPRISTCSRPCSSTR